MRAKKMFSAFTALFLSLSMTVTPVAAEVNGSETAEVYVEKDVNKDEGPANADTGYEKVVGEYEGEAILNEEADPSERDVLFNMLSIMDEYPEGRSWTNGDLYTPKAPVINREYPNGVTYTGGGCAGFAFLLSDAGFGESVPFYEKTDIDGIRVGDILRIKNNSGGEHSVVVLDIDMNELILGEGNYNSSIHWGRIITYEWLKQGNFFYRYTRYTENDPEATHPVEDYTASFKHQIPSDRSKSNTSFKEYNITVRDIRGKSRDKVFNGSSGRPTLLFFGGEGSCSNCHSTLAQIVSVLNTNRNAFDLFVFDDQNNMISVIKQEAAETMVGDLGVVSKLAVDKYRQKRSDVENALIDMYIHSQTLTIDSSYTMPLILCIDKNGNLADSSTGPDSAYEIMSMMEKCGAVFNNEPQMPEPGQNNNNNPASSESIKAFTSRLYNIILDREPDGNGLADWSGALERREKTGADVAEGFVLSPEYNNKHEDNKTFLRKMYLTFMDREPDAGGLNDWMHKLDQGYSRRFVAAGFINSAEFANICASYGIDPGQLIADDTRSDSNLYVDKEKVSNYVESLYKNILKRDSDAKGKQYWIDAIANHEKSAPEVARIGFFTSEEYTNKKTTNEQFLTDIYAAFFNRKPDDKGYNYWLERMSKGYTRDQVILEGFGESEEFGNILRSYGLKCAE